MSPNDRERAACQIRPGQRWTSKQGGYEVVIGQRATGMHHWWATRGKKTHRVHEGTLRKFYELGGTR